MAFSASRVLPEFDSNNALETVPFPIAMIDGDDWLENLSISTLSINKLNKQRNIDIKTEMNQSAPAFYQYYQKPLPSHYTHE